jgi:uncharacterized protein (DUF433 family)
LVDKGAIVAAFSADQVTKLTGLSMRQLSYWDETGFFKPQYASEDRRAPYSRIYSFTDIVGLRTISILKNVYNVSMRHLKETAEKLSGYTMRPWSDVKLAVWNREVIWIDPETGKPAGVVTGQHILFELIDVIDDMKQKSASLRARPVEEFGKIVRKRNVAHNRSVFAGTRIPVAAVIKFAEAGYSVEAILAEYPTLAKQDVEAALREKVSRPAA